MKISALAGMTTLFIVIKNRKFSQADHGPLGPMVAEAEILNKMWKSVEQLTMGPRGPWSQTGICPFSMTMMSMMIKLARPAKMDTFTDWIL